MSDNSARMGRRRVLQGLAAATGGATLAGERASAKTSQVDSGDMGTRFRRMLAGPDPVICPGAFDVISARLIVENGFDSVLLGGSAGSAARLGVPDYGLASITELIEVSARIADSVPVPVFADADDGGGSPLAVARAVRGFERAGLAAVMIEDHVQAKHLGDGGVLVDAPGMRDRVRAAADVRTGGMMLVARCDAVAIGLGESEAIERGAAYAEAGADLLFFAGLPPERIGSVSRACGRPVIASVHDTPQSTLRDNGVPLILYAGQLLRLALGAMQRGLQDIREGAAWPRYAERALSGEVYQRLIRSGEWREQARRYNLVDGSGRQVRG